MDIFSKKDKIIFLGIIILCVGLRLYKITGPIADWHSWRQADTAAVARLYVKNGVDLLRPRYFDVSNIQSGKDNPQGWRMVEFPLYQGLAALIVRAFPVFDIEIVLRSLTIAFSAGTAFFLILLVSAYMGKATGLLAGFYFSVLPYSVFYGRSILPEPLMVFLSVVSLYLASKRKMFLFSVLAAGLALLVKPVAAFFLLPVLYIFGLKKVFRLAAYGFFSILPLLLWRRWISQFPEGIPVYAWLLNEGNIRFKGAWFWWLFAERVGKLILGYWGLVLLGIGAASPAKNGMFRFLSMAGALAYFVVFARGNVQHDYYQTGIMPAVSILLACGTHWLWSQRENRWQFRGLVFVTTLFMLGFSWYTVRTYYWINRPEIVEAGRAADRLLPVDAKVIVPYNGDTTFLYFTGRQGWPLGFDIDKKIAMGATAYVTVSPTDGDFETRELAEKYTVLVRNDRYAIIDLTKKQTQ